MILAALSIAASAGCKSPCVRGHIATVHHEAHQGWVIIGRIPVAVTHQAWDETVWVCEARAP